MAARMGIGQNPARHSLAPIAATVVAIGLFATMDALMKRAAIASGVFPSLLVRSLLAAAVLSLAWAWRRHRQAWPSRDVLRVHALRGVVVAGMAGSYFWGLVRTPLAEAIAISFIAPLIALFLAAAMLGERLRGKAVAGSMVALLGVVVIAGGRIRTGGGGQDAWLGIAAILLSAVLYAWNLVLQRRQAQMAGPLEVVLFQNVFVAIALLLSIPLFLVAGDDLPALVLPAAAALPDIVGAALLASASIMLLTWAYARAEAQALVPIEYTAFPWSALTGWLWFDEGVTATTLGGLGLILLGVWIGARGAPKGQLPPA